MKTLAGPLVQLRVVGFSKWIDLASLGRGGRKALFCAGVDLVLRPFQDGGDRAVDLLSGAVTEDRTHFFEIA